LLKSRDDHKRSLSYDLNNQDFLDKLHNKIIAQDSQTVTIKKDVSTDNGDSPREVDYIYSSEFDGRLLAQNDQSVYNQSPRETIVIIRKPLEYQTSCSFKKPLSFIMGKRHLEKKIEKLLNRP
jgi:hypothetical protein